MVSVINDSLGETKQKYNLLAESYEHLLHEVKAQNIEPGTIKFEAAKTERITGIFTGRISIFNTILKQFAYEIDNLVNIVNSALRGCIHSCVLDSESLNN